MLDLGTLAGLHAHQHELHAFCPRCERWSVTDLPGMILAGHGERRLPITVRCKDCGEAGQLQVRPVKRRERMSRLIHQWKPWERSTGPRTTQGKAMASRNAWKGGVRPAVRKLARVMWQMRSG
jgi:ribosomal protein L34E